MFCAANTLKLSERKYLLDSFERKNETERERDDAKWMKLVHAAIGILHSPGLDALFRVDEREGKTKGKEKQER